MKSNEKRRVFGGFVVASSAWFNKRGIYLGRVSTRIHVALYRRSAGRFGSHVPGWPEARILLLDHVGARSGSHRTSPLIYHEHDAGFAVAASKGGQPTHPAWYFNLQAHPNTTIQIGSDVQAVNARIAAEAEHERLWSEFAAIYPGYHSFAKHAGNRRIPIVILEVARPGPV